MAMCVRIKRLSTTFDRKRRQPPKIHCVRQAGRHGSQRLALITSGVNNRRRWSRGTAHSDVLTNSSTLIHSSGDGQKNRTPVIYLAHQAVGVSGETLYKESSLSIEG